MYILIVDWKLENEFFLEREFKERKIEYKIFGIKNYSGKDRKSKIGSLNLYLKYFRLAYTAICNSEKNDTIICWNFTTSITCGYLCKILLKKRTILALNIIAHPTSFGKEILRKIFFYPVVSMRRYFLTVNSSIYIGDYSERFKINKQKFFELKDAIHYTQSIEAGNDEGYVFTGGEAQRDWETLFKACNKLPEINFVCIARKKNFDQTLIIPQNVRLLFDTDQDTFNEFLSKSKMVVLPLKSKLPCGLIILLQSALNKKAIIATRTPSIENYIRSGENGYLVEIENSGNLAENIKTLYYNKELQVHFASNLFDFVSHHHSPKQYTTRLIDIIENIELN